MKRAFFAAAAALGCLAVSTSAEDKPAYTAQDDAQCAAWATLAGSNAQSDDEDRNYAYAFNFFLGHYEGLTGHYFGDDLTVAVNAVDADPTLFDAYDAACQPRLDAYRNELTTWLDSIAPEGEGGS